MADNGMDRQKLAYFQEITGVKDSSLAHQILDAYGWDLDAAVQAMVDKDTNEIPEYQESMQVAAGGSSSETILTSSSTLLGNARVESTTTSINDNDHVDEQSIFERIGDGVNLYGPTGGMEEDLNAANVVWRVVTLPFILLRGSYKLIFGAVGLGVWVAGGVLNAGLGVLRLNQEPNQGGENETDIPSLAPVSVPTGASEAADFLRSFERRYGYYHPEFQAVSFMEAVRRAGQEFKFLFVYLHSAGHMNTPLFCEQTLCNEAVVSFINENFIAWGGDVHSAEGYQMGNSLKASTFPFCAVIMSSSSMRFGILQQVEGYRSAADLLSMLQKVIEEQSALLIANRQEQETRELNCRLRQEQDDAYQLGLQADQERERRQQAEAGRIERERFEADQKKLQEEKEAAQNLQVAAQKEATLAKHRNNKASALGAEPEKGPDVTHVAFRLPNGERRERRFKSTTKLQALFDYVESVGIVGTEKFSLVSNFPRKVYGNDNLEATIEEAGLHPSSSLFVQVDAS